MINSVRIGANYLIYSSVGRLILNKILFVAVNLLIYFINSPLLDIIAVILMCIPLIKKCIVQFVDKYYCGECTVMLSAVMLLAALNDVKSAVLLLVVYHILDFAVYIIYSKIYDDFWKSSAVFENPIDYRFDNNGNYLLSNNEYIPAEGEVISGNALVSNGRICAELQDVFPIHSGDKLLFSYKILSGSIHYRTFTKPEKSVYSAIKNYYIEMTGVNDDKGLSKLFDIFKAVLTVVFLAFASISLFFGVTEFFSFVVVSFSLYAAHSLLFVFGESIEYDFMTRLHKNGLYIMKKPGAEKINILEKNRIFENGDLSRQDIFSLYLTKEQARDTFLRLDKRRVGRKKALGILAAVCGLGLVLSFATASEFPMCIASALSLVAAVIIIKIK